MTRKSPRSKCGSSEIRSLSRSDEHPKATTADALAGLRPVFQKDGSVTAGNASGINDGAAAIVLARAEAAKAKGLTPKARVLAYAHAGVRPDVMGIGPIPAVELLLAKTGLTAADFDVIESNEAFAAQALAVSRALGFDPEKVNPNGGAIALGHPVGATGAILTLKALYELDRIQGSERSSQCASAADRASHSPSSAFERSHCKCQHVARGSGRRFIYKDD